jgi:hypothetical protein
MGKSAGSEESLSQPNVRLKISVVFWRGPARVNLLHYSLGCRDRVRDARIKRGHGLYSSCSSLRDAMIEVAINRTRFRPSFMI